MSKLNLEELSKITDKQLLEKLNFLKKELFNLRFQKSLGDLTNVSRFQKVKKDIARIKTELTRRKNNA